MDRARRVRRRARSPAHPPRRRRKGQSVRGVRRRQRQRSGAADRWRHIAGLGPKLAQEELGIGCKLLQGTGRAKILRGILGGARRWGQLRIHHLGCRRSAAPRSRSWESFVKESKIHGWPSFRDDEVDWRYVRVLPNGECVSVDGTHLGHNLPDRSGNRYCINLVSVAGRPKE